MKAELFFRGPATLGEGIFWDKRRNQIFFLDIEEKKIYILSQLGELVTVIDLPKMPGCMALDTQGDLVVAAEDSLYYISLPSQRIFCRATYPGIAFPLRFNDGKCDSQGRLIAGTMHRDQSEPSAKGAGNLLSITPDGVRTIRSQQTIPNGLAWNLQGNILYHIDTPTGNVDQFDYDARTGGIHFVRHCITVPKAEGSPDGMCIDTEGQLWIAHWGGYKVARYSPETGEKTMEISVAAENVTCCAFGGERMDTLYITTAKNKRGNGGGVYRYKTATQGTVANVYSNTIERSDGI